jgi:hypothetical protein
MNDHVCGFPLRKPHDVDRPTDLNRKSGGAQWRDLCVDALSWEIPQTIGSLFPDLPA